jgi:formylglycine-generating enzyme required for sulfatase activity
MSSPYSYGNTGFRLVLSSVDKSEVIDKDTYAGKAGDLKVFTKLEANFRWCPPGRFYMGIYSRFAKVTLSKGFWLGETEVTQGQWQEIMATTPWKGELQIREGKSYPATFVSWDDSQNFCEKLTQLERQAGRLKNNQSYRLPTEAEWEYACRAGTRTKYRYNLDYSSFNTYAWYRENTFDIGEKYAHEVGFKQANPWNLKDMYGNASEWCSDWHGDTLMDGRDPQGATSGTQRVSRGGSWLFPETSCSSYYSKGYDPKSRVNFIGFRLVLSSVE